MKTETVESDIVKVDSKVSELKYKMQTVDDSITDMRKSLMSEISVLEDKLKNKKVN